MSAENLIQAWKNGGRPFLLKAVKDRFEHMRRQMEQSISKPPYDGMPAQYKHADETDLLMTELYKTVFECVFPSAEAPDLTVCAVGGYGRKELAPFSDIDLLFLTNDDKNDRTQAAVSFILYLLWDSGVKVGASVGTCEERIERAKTDFETRTAFLEARFVCGNRSLFSDFERRFDELKNSPDAKDFLNAKLEERKERLRKTGGSKYMLEPNVKEGRGGLRDLNLAFWLAKYFFGTAHLPDLAQQGILPEKTVNSLLKAHRFLATVRCLLHLNANKSGDVLTLEAQKEIAKETGYAQRKGSSAVERFMKHYYLTSRKVAELCELVISAAEDRLSGEKTPPQKTIDPAFVIKNGKLALKNGFSFADDPYALLRAFDLKGETGVPFSPFLIFQISENAHLLRGLRKTEPTRRLFFKILEGNSPESSLRRMNETGVLNILIPAFGKITGQVQFDLYHVYTTDEHTFKTLGFLYEDAKASQSRKSLLTAGLLHDIAKGQGGGHDKKGAAIAETICADLAMSGEETETTVWLVANHLLMSHTAFKRDIFDPKTLDDFIAEVQSPERLRLLYALTKADIRAVGPNVWNGFKEQLLKSLFDAALERIQGNENRPRPLSDAQKKLAALPASDETEFAVETDNEKCVTSLTVLAPDKNGLFAQITGVLALENVSVAEAQIMTLKNGMALDTFLIQEIDSLDNDVRRPVSSAKKIARIQEKIKSIDPEAVEKELKRKKTVRKALWNQPRVLIDNSASDSCSLIEINASDAVGFLHTVTRAMTLADLKIVSAHIYTYGSKVVDVFYVTDQNGNKITDDEKAAQIKTSLLDAINGFAQFAG